MCFVGDTMVSTPFGESPMESLETGDRVISFNFETHQIQESTVSRTLKNEASEIYAIYLAGETIEVTAEHPFYVVGKEWTLTRDLAVGDKLRTIDGNAIPIEKIIRSEKAVTVYNVTVGGDHNYFVGDEGVLVHNK